MQIVDISFGEQANSVGGNERAMQENYFKKESACCATLSALSSK